MLLHLDEASDTYALQNEAFAPVLAFYSLAAGNDGSAFLSRAAHFLNSEVWGGLSTTLIVRDEFLAAHPQEVEGFIDHVRYGTVALNAWSSSSYGISVGTWGGYPGETLDNVASGIGVVGNHLMLRQVERTVFRAPFIHDGQRILRGDGSDSITPPQARAISDLTQKFSAWRLMNLIWHMTRSGPPKLTPGIIHSAQATTSSTASTAEALF